MADNRPNTQEPSPEEIKVMQDWIDSAKNTFLSPSDRTKLLEYNSKLKLYRTRVKVLSDNLTLARNLNNTIDKRQFARDIVKETRNNAQLEIKKEINNELKDVEGKINSRLTSMGLDAINVNKGITKISNFMQGDRSLRLPSSPIDLLNSIGSARFGAIAGAFGLQLPPIPTIPRIPSLKSLKAMVKFPVLGSTVKRFKNGAKKLGKMKKKGTGISSPTPSSLIDAVNRAKNLTKQVPELSGAMEKLSKVQSQLEDGTDIAKSLTDKISAMDNKLNMTRNLSISSNISPNIAEAVLRYKNSINK